MGLVQLLTVGTVWLLFLRPDKLPRFGPISVSLSVFVGLMVVSGYFGIDPSLSFWGGLERESGGFMWLHLLALFFIARVLFHSRREWLTLLHVSVGVAVIVSVIQLLLLSGTQVAFAASNGSTIGNSSFLGAYLIFHIFFALIIAFQSKWRMITFYGVLAALFLTGTLSISTANAAFISVLGGFMLFGGLLLLASKSVVRRRIGVGALLALSTVTIVVFVMAFVPQSIVQRAFTQLATGSRFIAWDMAWQGIQERPWLGWGPETFQEVSHRFYNPCLGSEYCGGGMWFDRAHNKVLDVWIEVGVIGLISYLSIFFFVLLGMFRAVRTSRLEPLTAAAITSALAAYFIQNLTILDIPIVLTIWVLTLALVETMTKNEAQEDDKRGVEAPRWLILVPVVTTIVVYMAFNSVLAPSIKGVAAVVDANNATTGQERITAYNTALTQGYIGIDARRAYLANQSGTVVWSIDAPTLEQILPLVVLEIDSATSALQDTIDHSPNPLRAYLEMGLLYHVKAREIDPLAFQQAEEVLQTAIDQNPFHPQAYWELSSVYLDQGKVEEALALTSYIREISPEVSNAHLFHVIALAFSDDQDALEEAIDQALEAHPKLESKIMDARGADRDTLLHQLYL